MVNNIKCIAFDWGGVLIDNPVEEFAQECAKRIGVKPDQLKSSYAEFAYKFERGLIQENALWRNIGNRLNISIQSDNSIWYDCFKTIYSPRKEIFDIAKSLKKEGYFIALLSNTEVPAMQFFLNQKYKLFDYTIFSCAEGEAKPEPDLYKILLNKMNIPANQTLFIDDKYENIQAAKNLGMITIHFTNHKSFYDKLKALHILY
jgi:putative hydrolase of the HAD superfamily